MVNPAHNIKKRFDNFNKWDKGLLASRSPHCSRALRCMCPPNLQVAVNLDRGSGGDDVARIRADLRRTEVLPPVDPAATAFAANIAASRSVLPSSPALHV
jgi:hypothetical protein